jgi:two-component system chemotaxis response regulator CheB
METANVLGRRVRVLIVDDSAIVRQILTRELGRDSRIEIVGAAPDPYVARDMIVELRPDVVTLDVEMPRMDGITFLRKLMKSQPMPVIVISTLTAQGTQTAIEALGAGAVDVVGKPTDAPSLAQLGPILVNKVMIAALARVQDMDGLAKTKPTGGGMPSDAIFAIGASTGGVQALTEVLTRLHRDSPPTLIVQHMPARFTGPFAERLGTLCEMQVREAVDGDIAEPGTALIAPGGFHMLLRRAGGKYRVEIKDGPDVCHQKPSVDVLFNSVAKVAGASAIGAILTGMGSDGAQGLLRMRQAGAKTIAQDQASCVVFGMPGEAIKCGAVQRTVPLDYVAHAMVEAARSKVPLAKQAG